MKHTLSIGVGIVLIVLGIALFFAGQDSQEHAHATIATEEQFIAEMIPHHQEAIDTSTIIYEKSTNEELRALALRIITAQEAEIMMMESWKQTWYHHGTYESQYVPMMPDLTILEGEALDRAFLEGMIEHHEGAIVMAEAILETNPRQEITAFAEAIIAVQSDEIDEMKMLLH